MKIFYGDFDSINFVDENNVFVGYSLEQNCCEHADWFISDQKKNTAVDENDYWVKNEIVELSSYSFDTKFFEEFKDEYCLDNVNFARFKLISENKPDLYLHLYNCHNGYYSHGFEFKIGEDTITRGDL